MQVTGDWLTAAGTQAVLRLLNSAGYEAYCVGGCVRNALLGVPVADVDIATNAEPTRVAELAEAAGYKVVPTGIDHGTVTVVVDSEPYEVTTYRNDVETDGRRAVVTFATDIAEDARRRDFTVNALYVQADGTLVDPLGGYPDIAARRIRFIEDASTRIEEDYLRILRFFRFYAWYGDGDMDAEGLAACASHVDGIAKLSKERIGAEMAKLLAAPDPAPTVAAMAASGVLAQVIGGADITALAPLVHIEQTLEIAPRWQRRLAALGGNGVAKALRLSKADATYLKQVRAADCGAAEAGYRFGSDVALDAKLIEAASLGAMPDSGLLADVTRGAAAVFPVRAADLMDRFDKGPALGAELRRLEDVWIKSGFSAPREKLLSSDVK